MVKALYLPTKQKCWVNMDFIVDVFEEKGSYVAYTFDNERGGYRLDREEFEKWKGETDASIQSDG